MSTPLTWEAVLQRSDLIGGDIESTEDGVVFRGPLLSITQESDMIVFHSPWCARRDPETGQWRNWGCTRSTVNKDFVPACDLGDGRVMFYMPCLGPCILFPKGVSPLDPSWVQGLLPASRRLRKLYPDLPFNLEVATAIAPELSADQGASPGTLDDFLGLFSGDRLAEEFLGKYIERLTGEPNINQKIY